jgi:hypothetical protein
MFGLKIMYFNYGEMSGVRKAKSEQTDLSVLSGIEHKEQINWDDLLQMLEEWFEDGTESFEAMFAGLQLAIDHTDDNQHLMKVSKVMGFLRGVICWHNTTSSKTSQEQLQWHQEDQQ